VGMVTTIKKYTITFQNLTIVGIGTTKQDAFKNICATANGVGIQSHWLDIKNMKYRPWNN
jgi:hypothetical protein